LLADETAVPQRPLETAKEIPLATHIYALASHLVYGWITETVRSALRRACSGGLQPPIPRQLC